MKKFDIKKLLLVTMLVVAMLFVTACGSDTTGDDATEAEDSGLPTLVIGVDDTFAPMAYRDEAGELIGFDIDMATYGCELLGMEPVFTPIDWTTKEALLSAGTIDCIWNGFSVTPSRIEGMALTYQYLDNAIIIMTLADSDIDVTCAEDLEKYKIGTQGDTSAMEVLQSLDNFDKFSGNITQYTTYDTAILDLQAGRTDIITIDKVLGEYTNNNLDGALKVCTYDLGSDCFAIACEKDNTELRDKINEALQTMTDDGTLSEISEKWFGYDITMLEPIEGEE